MKKWGIRCLAFLCCACLAFTAGLFVGRNINHAPIQLPSVPVAAKPSAQAPASPTPAPSTAPLMININTASAEQLQQLPGIGETLASRILSYRQVYGPFSDVTELTKVSGIGTARLEAIIDYITVGG